MTSRRVRTSAIPVPNTIARHGHCPRIRAKDSPPEQPQKRRGLSGLLLAASEQRQTFSAAYSALRNISAALCPPKADDCDTAQ